MKAAMIGCGRLGMPVALAWASEGHDMVGYDISPVPKEIMASRRYPHLEPGCQKLLDDGVKFPIVDSMMDAVAHADIVFVAVETPHQPAYEGLTRMPEERADFDYAALCKAVKSIATEAEIQRKQITLVIISTCLPGTCDRDVMPLLNPFVSLVYAPMFIAQSTVVEDALNPEFVLLGVDKANAKAVEQVSDFFSSMHPKWKLCFMSVVSAELTKVSYNSFLGLKIAWANTTMEIAHKTGANCDDVTDALAMATDRLISDRYMRGGMGDGGGCHPRDQIALSWLAESLCLSFDLFGAMVKCREDQTDWLADLCVEESGNGKMPVVVLGKAYKKGTNLTIGSPAILLANLLREYKGLKVHQYDPYVDGGDGELQGFFVTRHEGENVHDIVPAVYIIATDHDEFFKMGFPAGSTVIDPWGKMPNREGCKVIRVGR